MTSQILTSSKWCSRPSSVDLRHLLLYILRHSSSFLGSYEGVSKSFRTGRLERELQLITLGAVVSRLLCQSSEFCRHNCLCCFSTSVYCCYFVMAQSGYFWIHPHVVILRATQMTLVWIERWRLISFSVELQNKTCFHIFPWCSKLQLTN
jgi:hypothetical protein